MAKWGGAGHGKSGAMLARGCFLLPMMMLLLLLLLLLDEAHAFTARQPTLALGNHTAKFRGSRAASLHPTAIVFSRPYKNKETQQQQPLKNLGSTSSSFIPPSVVSRAPSTNSQLDLYSQSIPSFATPAITSAPHTPPPSNTRGSGSAIYPPKQTFTPFGHDRGTRFGAGFSRSESSHTFLAEGGGGWAGLKSSSGQDRWSSPRRTPHAPDTPDAAASIGRQDTFGHPLSENLSYANNRWQVTEGETAPLGSGRAGRRPVLNGGPRMTHLWPTDKVVEIAEEEVEVDDEGGQRILDFNTTAEYQPEDYSAYHEYGHSGTPERDRDPSILTFEHVMEMHNLTSQLDLHTLLNQRGISPEALRDFLNDGASKKAVIEFLKASSSSITTTSPPDAHDVLVIDEGYQHNITRQVSEREDADVDRDRKERKNRRKGGKNKGGRRKNRKRKKKVQREREDTSETTTSPSPPPHPWVPTTPRTLPEVIMYTTAATTQQPTPDTLNKSPPSVKTSDVSIVSVTLVEAPSDPRPETPLGQPTFVEGFIPPRRQNPHRKTSIWEEHNPRKVLRPPRPSLEPDKTINEVTDISFVKEKQRDDYVFPLRGLLIISGLMGALAVFTLVVLISYAVIKCSKKPVVNNYQVSEQQKPAGT